MGIRTTAECPVIVGRQELRFGPRGPVGRPRLRAPPASTTKPCARTPEKSSPWTRSPDVSSGATAHGAVAPPATARPSRSRTRNPAGASASVTRLRAWARRAGTRAGSRAPTAAPPPQATAASAQDQTQGRRDTIAVEPVTCRAALSTALEHRLIDGRAFAAELLDNVRAEVADLRSRGQEVGIATLLVGDDYAASVYQRRIDRHARESGIISRPVGMPADATFGEVVGKIAELDVDPEVTGILVLRPLPDHLDDARVFRRLPVLKDVEAQHPENAGLLALGMPRFVPSTPAAAFHMLDRYMVSIGRDPRTAYDGLDLVLVGRSNNVGKPAAILGLQRNATVISAHKHTYEAGRLATHTSRADILIVAAGVPGLITAEHVQPGAIVVDIGINPVPGPDGKTRLVGDVDTESVLPVVRAVSPVPGGVGPITDAWVLRNTVLAARALASRGR